ncbi:hypothetical protein CesoFtcFv8_026570 [Champsocephalus esox]|uniref:Ig-like domain-containing protein n=1 Tax=Champsocephalus esox TaxID=159716 RepID=A0AAN8AZE2_9TELE|nr:hypothetical protein CesoFtcFv8_026570 [Champsocephalus esox]
MRLASGLLCVLVSAVSAQSGSDGPSSHHVQRRDAKPQSNYTGVIGTKLQAFPTWFVSAGSDVTIHCKAHTDEKKYGDKVYLHLAWTDMRPGNRTKKIVASRPASAGITYELNPVTHEHQGVYTCDDNGSLPEVYVLDWHSMLWVEDAPPKASMDVLSHNRSQFFSNEAFTLGCQLPDDNAPVEDDEVGLLLVAFNDWTGTVTECPGQVSSDHRLSSTITPVYLDSYSLYWCENPAGDRSNSLNVSIASVTVLESPPLPVMEGEDVMLRCFQRDRKTKEISSSFHASYYKNSRLIDNRFGRGPFDQEGNFTLRAVTKADEGVYTCKMPEAGGSFESWLSVKARPVEE